MKQVDDLFGLFYDQPMLFEDACVCIVDTCTENAPLYIINSQMHLSVLKSGNTDLVYNMEVTCSIDNCVYR